jgi:hypothetical protein
LTFNKGSLILVDYTAKVKDTNEVFETTIEAEAKKHSLHDPDIKYQPKLVSVGESWVIKGLDEALANSKVGDKLSCLCIPYFVDDMRVYYEEVTIESIEVSKTGKRVKVVYSNGSGVSNIGLNTYFQPITDKWVAEMINERGLKE